MTDQKKSPEIEALGKPILREKGCVNPSTYDLKLQDQCLRLRESISKVEANWQRDRRALAKSEATVRMLCTMLITIAVIVVMASIAIGAVLIRYGHHIEELNQENNKYFEFIQRDIASRANQIAQQGEAVNGE